MHDACTIMARNHNHARTNRLHCARVNEEVHLLLFSKTCTIRVLLQIEKLRKEIRQL